MNSKTIPWGLKECIEYNTLNEIMASINMSIEDNREISFDCGCNVREIDGCGTLETTTSFDENGFRGSYRELVFDDFKVGYGSLTAIQNCQIDFDFTGQSIEMIFVTKGSLEIGIPKVGYTSGLGSNEHNIFFYPCSMGYINLSDKNLSLFIINLSPNFFTRFLPEETKFEDFRELIHKNRIGQLKKRNHPITLKMSFLINEIMGSKLKGHYRKMYINAKILEIMLLQLEQFQTSSLLGERKEVDMFEKEKIIKAKEYILRHYGKPLTLQLLCKKIGTNEFALKKGFKIMYGLTVFGYINDLRMDKAKGLLREKCFTISQVSEKMGYKNPQHFSTAFKKKFGIPPSKMV